MEFWTNGSFVLEILSPRVWVEIENASSRMHVLRLPCRSASLLFPGLGSSYHSAALSTKWHSHLP